jgi:peptide deformylase
MHATNEGGALRGLRYYGDPILRKAAERVPEVDGEIRAMVREMVETMRDRQGVGLAAEQVGLSLSLCVLDVPPEADRDADGKALNPGVPMPMALVNPEIVSVGSDLWTLDEGCLSFPGIVAPVRRPYTVRVRYLDGEGEAREQELHGFVARVIQHEVDHLNGVLFIDRMSYVKRVALTGRLKRMRGATLARIPSAERVG